MNSFQKFIKAGPLCEEPVSNCAFIIKQFDLVASGDEVQEVVKTQQMSAEEAAVLNLYKEAFQGSTLRLMEPIFKTSIQV